MFVFVAGAQLPCTFQSIIVESKTSDYVYHSPTKVATARLGCDHGARADCHPRSSRQGAHAIQIDVFPGRRLLSAADAEILAWHYFHYYLRPTSRVEPG